MKIKYFVLAVAFFLTAIANAQTTVVSGTIVDDATNDPIPYVNVFFPTTNKGTSADEQGHFQIKSDTLVPKIEFTFVGYRKLVRTVTAGKEQVMNIRLIPEDSRTLGEVVIKPKKFRYHNKNNPAVELIDLVIQNRDRNRLSHFDYADYDEYEKMTMSFSNTEEKLRKNLIFRSVKYMMDNIDTTTLPGRALLPWYIQELTSKVYYRHDPEKKKTYVTGNKKVDFGDILDNAGLSAYIKHMYQDIDIYQNNILVMTNQFLSPIANGAPTFYKYFVTDTVQVGPEKWVELSFFPRNKADFLFQGKLYVTLNGRYAVPKADMTISKDINLNWVKDLHAVLDFERNEDSSYRLKKSTLYADFRVLQNSKGGIFGKRIVSFNNYHFNVPQPDSVYKGLDVEQLSKADVQTDSFWNHNRQDTLSEREAKTYENIEKLKGDKKFQRKLDIAMLFIAGYKKASPFVEVGPVNAFYSFNPVEGFRLRAGGRTTTHFSKRFYLESYVAYGFKDERWKYFLGGTYSFNGESIYKFPQHLLRANFQRDTKIPGQELQFVQEDNFLLSFKRGVNDKWLYNDIYNLQYVKEFMSHLSYQVSYKNWQQEAAGGLSYKVKENGAYTTLNHIITSEVGLQLRWAPHEEFYQGKKYRVPIINKYPIFTLRSNIGIKDFINGQYNYQNFTLNIYKHVYVSQLGYSDVVMEGGYIAGKGIPFPLLDIHHANQTYGLQLQSYNMMNFLEFVSDHYASFMIDHNFNGFIFNKIPLLKKLRFREMADFKLLYGGLRDENNPNKTAGLVGFPVDENGNKTTFALGSTPYVEGSLGIGNIFNFFRVDYVRRFTYLDNPNIAQNGIRLFARFDF